MKQVCILCLMLFSFNAFSQTRITRINNKKYSNLQVIKRTKFKKKETQSEIDGLSMESKKVGKTVFPMLYRYGKKKLILNGAGVRELFWLDLYACGLYLTNSNNDPRNIIETNKSMIIRLDILSGVISKQKLIKAVIKGFEKSNTEQIILEHKYDLMRFISFLDSEIKEGDKYDIVYSPGLGTSLYLNYKLKGTIKGASFKSSVFNIWLSNNPADKSLKKELLGIKSINKK